MVVDYHLTVKKCSYGVVLLLTIIYLPITYNQFGYYTHLYFWRKAGTPFSRFVWSNKLKLPSLANVINKF